MNPQLKIQELLKVNFEQIKLKNEKYSIRSYSKKVGISAGTLSLIMLGKRNVSEKLARKIAESLSLDPQESSELLALFKPSYNISREEKFYTQLETAQFDVISEWYFLGILNLVKTKNFQSNDEWIADRLGINVNKVEKAIQKLKMLGLLVEENGKYSRAESRYRTSDGVINAAVKKSHQETFNLAQDALDQFSPEERDFTHLTVAVDQRKLNEIKTLIRKFEDDLVDIVEDGDEQDEVYRLNIGFFPLSKIH